jgi:hypothetical protein
LKNDKAVERLKSGICSIAKELEFDIQLTKNCIENLSKEQLIEKFIELKELRLKVENARLINYLLEEESEAAQSEV